MEKLTTTLKTAAVNLDMFNLAFDLGILSKISYKNKNQHRVNKFFQAEKKIERNMRKFTNLDLRCFIQNEFSLPPSLRFTTDFILDLSSRLIKAFLYIHEARKCCVECAGHSLKILRMAHFVALHTVLIAVVSNVWNMVGELQNDIRNWYEALELYSQSKNIQLSPFPSGETICYDLNYPAKTKIAVDLTNKAISALQKRFEGSKKIDSIQAKLLLFAGDVAQDPDTTDDNNASSVIQKENSIDLLDLNSNVENTNAENFACPLTASHNPSRARVDVGVAVTRKLVDKVNEDNLNESTKEAAGGVKKRSKIKKVKKKCKEESEKESMKKAKKKSVDPTGKKLIKKFKKKSVQTEEIEKDLTNEILQKPISKRETKCEKKLLKKDKKKSIHKSISENELDDDSSKKSENRSARKKKIKKVKENAVEADKEHKPFDKIKKKKLKKDLLVSDTTNVDFCPPTQTPESAKKDDDLSNLRKKRKREDLNDPCAAKRLKQVSN